MRPLVKRMLLMSAPHVIINTLLILYLVIGAGIFVLLDQEMAKENFREIVLFTFTTITTIGYGKICPKTDAAKLFCIVYSAFGIPLLFLALGNLGKFLTEGYWLSMICLTKTIRSRPPDGETRLPFLTINYLLLFMAIVGAVLFHHWDGFHFIQALYFSVITITTVGFGDYAPEKLSSVWHLIAVMSYIGAGMVVMSTFVAALNGYLHKIHYIGRKFTGAGKVQVWFGGQSVSVAGLVQIVASKFQVSPMQLREVLHDLDALIGEATEQNATVTDRRMSLLGVYRDQQQSTVDSSGGGRRRYKSLEKMLAESSEEERRRQLTAPHVDHSTHFYMPPAFVQADNKAIHALEVVYDRTHRQMPQHIGGGASSARRSASPSAAHPPITRSVSTAGM